MGKSEKHNGNSRIVDERQREKTGTLGSCFSFIFIISSYILNTYKNERRKRKMEYLLTNENIQQLIVRYNNAKAEYRRLKNEGNPDWQFECGRAYAL